MQPHSQWDLWIFKLYTLKHLLFFMFCIICVSIWKLQCCLLWYWMIKILHIFESILFKSHIYCAELSTLTFLLGGSCSGTRSAWWGWKKQSFHCRGLWHMQYIGLEVLHNFLGHVIVPWCHNLWHNFLNPPSFLMFFHHLLTGKSSIILLQQLFFAENVGGSHTF